MYNQSGLPINVQVNLSGWSLLFGAGRVLQDLLVPKAEWSGIAVSLPHWIEMTPSDPLSFLSGGEEWGKTVPIVAERE
jgi:hypothetical protein